MTTSRTTRTTSGRFTVGNAGGPGRPRRATETSYMQTMLAAVPLDTWETIVKAAVVAAEGGDATARQWLGRYLCGTPAGTAPTVTETIVHTLLDEDEPLARAAAIKAKAAIDGMRFPILFEDRQAAKEDALIAEAARELLAAEAARASEST